MTILPCDHGFHHGCFNEWLKRSSTCPCCRAGCPTDISLRDFVENKYSDDYLKLRTISLELAFEGSVENLCRDEMVDMMVSHLEHLRNGTKSVSAFVSFTDKIIWNTKPFNPSKVRLKPCRAFVNTDDKIVCIS